MTQEERVKKYTDFANSLLYAAKEGNLTDVVNTCKRERIDTHFFAWLTKKGWIYLHARGKKGRWYKSDRDRPFTSEEVEEILLELATRTKVNAMNSTPRTKPSLSEMGSPLIRLLSEYTPRELIDELKRRGYSGKLIFTKEIKF